MPEISLSPGDKGIVIRWGGKTGAVEIHGHRWSLVVEPKGACKANPKTISGAGGQFCGKTGEPVTTHETNEAYDEALSTQAFDTASSPTDDGMNGDGTDDFEDIPALLEESIEVSPGVRCKRDPLVESYVKMMNDTTSWINPVKVKPEDSARIIDNMYPDLAFYARMEMDGGGKLSSILKSQGLRVNIDKIEADEAAGGLWCLSFFEALKALHNLKLAVNVEGAPV